MLVFNCRLCSLCNNEADRNFRCWTNSVDNKIERLDREKKKVELNSIYNKENNSLGTNHVNETGLIYQR